jgi:hypothetical protein
VVERVRTFARTWEPQALSQPSVRVPQEDARESPAKVGRLASQMLNGDDWDLTPQPSEGMDDAEITVLPAPGEREDP